MTVILLQHKLTKDKKMAADKEGGWEDECLFFGEQLVQFIACGAQYAVSAAIVDDDLVV